MEYKTVIKASQAELVERKSRFIACLAPAETEQAAIGILNDVRKKNREAAHNVYAYILRENNIERFSDDGEPQGTAGLPVLNVFKHEGLYDCIIIVTRYFGGTLLGTGGLVRAYSGAAAMALHNAVVILKRLCCEYKLHISYNFYTPVLAFITDVEGVIINSDFADEIILYISVPKVSESRFSEGITEITSGRAVLEKISEKFA